MKKETQAELDQIEDGNMGVLVEVDGKKIGSVPREWLPEGVEDGDDLIITIETLESAARRAE